MENQCNLPTKKAGAQWGKCAEFNSKLFTINDSYLLSPYNFFFFFLCTDFQCLNMPKRARDPPQGEEDNLSKKVKEDQPAEGDDVSCRSKWEIFEDCPG